MFIDTDSVAAEAADKLAESWKHDARSLSKLCAQIQGLFRKRQCP